MKLLLLFFHQKQFCLRVDLRNSGFFKFMLPNFLLAFMLILELLRFQDWVASYDDNFTNWGEHCEHGVINTKIWWHLVMFWLRLFRVTVQPVWILFWKIARRCGKQGGMFHKIRRNEWWIYPRYGAMIWKMWLLHRFRSQGLNPCLVLVLCSWARLFPLKLPSSCKGL